MSIGHVWRLLYGVGCARPQGQVTRLWIAGAIARVFVVPRWIQGAWLILILLACSLAAGCSIGPRTLESTRLRYNEAVKTTSEEQLLLNIVRLRYTDTPSSLSVSAIVEQPELEQGIQLIPFFEVGGEVLTRRMGIVLPGAQALTADRPTITLTPLDDQEFTRQLFTQLPLEGVLYLAKTTWPISTVFRLYLENLNWVSNAQSASGPTPQQAPEFAEFQRGIEALQKLQDRGYAVFTQEERAEQVGGALPAKYISADAIVEATKNDQEYRPDKGGATWTLFKKVRQPVLYIHPEAIGSPEMSEFTRIFRLKSGLDKYDLNIESLSPFPETYPPEGVTAIDLETRSLLQVLYFVSQGVEVPAEHSAGGLARVTMDGTRKVFDWQQVLGGLFKVHSASGKDAPPGARVAVRYRDYWFYIVETDHDTLSTFSLLLELSRMQLAGQTGLAPVLTLPLGGR
jgi:hypothetical protein